jgi:hypothetical protein
VIVTTTLTNNKQIKEKKKKGGLFLYYTYSANVRSTYKHAACPTISGQEKPHVLHGKKKNTRPPWQEQAGSEDFDVPSFPYNFEYLGPLDTHIFFSG